MTTDERVTEATAHVNAGERVSDETLLELSSLDVLALGALADTARRFGSREVTYSRVHVLTLERIQADLFLPSDMDELRLVTLPASFEEAGELVACARAVLPTHVGLTAFSWSELSTRASTGWGPLADVLSELSRLGARDVAEIPIDQIPDLPAALRMGRACGLRMSRLTVDTPLGARRAQELGRARAAVEREGGVAALAPLSTRPRVDVPTTGYDDLRTVALARLALAHLARAGTPVSVEVDWRLYGPKLAQVALIFGADHLAGVPATNNSELGARRETVAELERNIRAAGFEPRRADHPS